MKSRGALSLLGGVFILFSWQVFAQPQPLAVSTVAGLANFGSADGIGSTAKFLSPNSVALDSASNLYVADGGNFTIRKITPAGVVTTIAGQPQVYGTNDGTGTNALFNTPYGIAVDSAGNVYVADSFNFTIREIATNGQVSTIAGHAGAYGANNGPASGATFLYPYGIAVDGSNNIYVADTENNLIREISSGSVKTLAGDGTFGTNDGATGDFAYPYNLAVDAAGNVYVADWYYNLIRKVTPAGVITTIAGNTGTAFNSPSGIAVDKTGTLYVADTGNQVIRVIAGTDIYTLAGDEGFQGDADGIYPQGTFSSPWGIAVDGAGNVFVGDSGNGSIRKIAPGGNVSTMAGPDESYGTGTDGPVDGAGTQARFYHPSGVAVDQATNIYVADSLNNCIRAVTPTGIVTTLAGSSIGESGSGDGTNTGAEFNNPTGVCLDAASNIYVADYDNSTIRKITPDATHANWVTTTIAGKAGAPGNLDLAGTNARFSSPFAIAVDNATNLYVADSGNNAIRKITPGGAVSTLASNLDVGGVAVDSLTNVYVSGSNNNVIYVIATNGAVSTLNNFAGFNAPQGIAISSSGNIYVANTGSNTILGIDPGGKITSIVAGTNGLGNITLTGSSDGLGPAAQFDHPTGLAVDSAGNVYIADVNNNTVRKGTIYSAGQTVVLTLATSPSGLALAVNGTSYSSTPQILTFATGAAVTNTGLLNVGYVFTNWTTNGVVTTTSSNYTATLTTNLTVTANYVPGYTLTVTASPAYAGTAAGEQTFLLGTTNTVTVMAAASNGYTFTGWTTNGGSTVASTSTNYSFSITNNLALVANFAVDAPQIELFNGTSAIADNQTSPVISFGSVQYGSSAPAIVFTVTNTGTAALTLQTPSVPAGYTLTASPPGTISVAGNGTFTVRLNTNSTGTFSGNIVITNNDSNHDPFSFAISGTVTPAPLIITALPQTSTYGTNVPTNTTVIYNGFVHGETNTALTTGPTVSSAHSGVQPAGTYTNNYTASGAVDGNYSISYAAGNLIVNPTALLITALPQTSAYGANVPTNTTVIYNGFVHGETNTALTTGPTISSAHSGVLPVGTYANNYTASGAVDGNYSISYAGGTLTVSKASLLITAQPQTITYGAVVPTTTLVYTGFVNGETNTALTVQAAISSGTNGMAAAGTYAGNYTASGAVDNNYTISYAAGTLTVNALPVVLTGTRHYDGTASATNSILSVSNIVGSDAVSVVSGSGVLSGKNIGTNAISSAGTLALGGAQSNNYTLTGVGGAVIVTPAPLVITAQPQTTTYGSNVPSTTVTYNGFASGETNTALSPGPTISSALSGVQPAGTYTGNYTASGAGDSNYSISYLAGNLTVNPAPLLITAQPQTITQGQTVPATTVTYTSFVNGDTVASLTTAPTISSAQTGVVAPGIYVGNYTASGAVDPNYSISYASGTLTVNSLGPEFQVFDGTNVITNTQTSPPVSFGGVQYGSAPPVIVFTVTNPGSATVTVEMPALPPGYTLTTNPPGSIDAGASGTFSVQFNTTAPGTYSGNIVITNSDPNHDPFSFAIAGTVNPAPLLITAQPQTIVYGATVPATTVTYNGFVNGDTNTSLTTGPTVLSASSGVAAAGVYAGNYTASGAVDTNYTISYAAGTLTVNPRPVILTGTRGYDGTALATNSILSVSNAVGSDAITVASGSVTLSATNVGTNAISSFGSLALGGAQSNNYTLIGASGTVIVTPVPLVVTAEPQATTYGSNVPPTTVTYSGFVAGETNTSLTTGPTIFSVHSGVLSAGIYPNNYAASGVVDANYSISYVPGTLFVNSAPLLITALPQTSTYGTNVPTSTSVIYSGFVNGETNTALMTQPSVSSAHSGVTAVGTYVSNYTASGAVDGNYSISYAGGTLTVSKASLLITALSQTSTYGTNVPTNTIVIYNGFVNGETNTSLNTSPTISSAHSGVQPVGTYTNNYTASGAVDANYSISYVAGNLTVNPTALLITAQPRTATYGTNVPTTTTVIYNGFVNGETNTALTTQPTLFSAHSGVTPVGTYVSNYTASGAVDGNYSISYAGGTLTVNKTSLLITAQPQMITYGTIVPATTLVYTGFVNGETNTALTAQPTISSVKNGVTAAGTYAGNYTASGAADNNYTISYAAGTLTVNALPVVLTGTRHYDGTASATNSILSVSNIVGSDAVSVVSGSGVLSGKNIGTNAISSAGTLALGGAQSNNYTLTGVGGAVIVTPAPLVITAQPQTTTYGSNVPSTTVTYNGFASGETNTALSPGPTISSVLSGVQPAGTYTGNYTASGAGDSNYSISYVAGNLTVSPAPLLITAQPQTSTYGTNVPTTTTVTYNAFVNGDTAASLTAAPTISAAHSGLVPVGVYVSNYTASGAVDSNYTITYAAGTLTVNAGGPLIQVFVGTNTITNNQTNVVDFGGVTLNQTGPIITFTVSNIGGETLDVGPVSAPAGFSVVTNPPETIGVASNGMFSVQLDSTALGAYSGNISFTNNDTNNLLFKFPIAGLVNGALISLSGNLAFGVVVTNTPAQGSFTISNGGNAPLTISNIAFPAGFSGTWTNTIAAGGTATVMVTFLPTAPIYYDGAVAVVSDAITNAGAIPVSGFGANVNATLTILTNGNGKVTPNLAKVLKVGTHYTLTATPASGSLFSNWTGSIITNKNPLAFAMRDSIVLQANFVTNPFTPLVGAYNGLFTASNGVTEDTAGMLKGLTVNQKGAYSGSLLFNGETHAISGTFSLDGQATNIVKLPASHGNLVLTMTLMTANVPAPQISGVVNGTNSGVPWQAALTADFGTNIVPASAYTMLIPPDTNNPDALPPNGMPGGDGYALINYVTTPARSAKATITGALADGTTFSQTVPVSKDGFVPVYSALYAGKGLLLGWINLDLAGTNFGVNGLTWIHPVRSTGSYANGFTDFVGPSSALLSAWTNSPFGGSIFASMTNLSILATINDTNTITNVAVSINSSGKVSGTAVTGAINPKTGYWKITVGKGANLVTGFGAVLLNTNFGGGYYLTKTNIDHAIKLSP